jgi:hypothetical protein
VIRGGPAGARRSTVLLQVEVKGRKAEEKDASEGGEGKEGNMQGTTC